MNKSRWNWNIYTKIVKEWNALKLSFSKRQPLVSASMCWRHLEDNNCCIPNSRQAQIQTTNIPIRWNHLLKTIVVSRGYRSCSLVSRHIHTSKCIQQYSTFTHKSSRCHHVDHDPRIHHSRYHHSRHSCCQCRFHHSHHDHHNHRSPHGHDVVHLHWHQHTERQQAADQKPESKNNDSIIPAMARTFDHMKHSNIICVYKYDLDINLPI